ncbi:MAG: single-stranded DNA-binding protein, partial [Microbacteriaceae bacterium]
TTPRHIVTSEGLAITSFRLASNQRRYDRTQEKWVEGDTNWYTVTSFRQLALNSAQSINKGDRILVSGRLRIRDWESGERSGTTIEIEADALGHDISWGVSSYQRTSAGAQNTEAQGVAEYPNPDEPAAAESPTEVAWAG